jgi:outer membrane protein OmpA-like peptidoglycan-associated protein
MRTSKRFSIAATASLALALIPSVASAQEYSRWVFRLELGAGTMLRDFVHEDVNTSSLAGALNARVAYRLFEPVSFQFGAGAGRFFQPENRDDVPLIAGFGGLRVAPKLSQSVRLWVDGDVAVHAVGSVNRFGLDAGLGLDFFLSDTIAIGPYARFNHTFNGRDGSPNRLMGVTFASNDTQWWTAGVSLSIHSLADAVPVAAAPPPPPAPTDGDHDGVNDADDQCATEPAGEHPDSSRTGCPAPDEDRDGVFGADDQCPTEAVGEHPDPARAGCPASDEDHDGVFGADDQCPTEAVGEHPNPERAGCADADGDHDGVFDHGDQCPAEPAGIHPDSARAGCPAPDRDHDNVPDAVDHCPDRAGAPSANPTRNGCPGLVVMENGALRILRPVQFRPNSAVILPVSFPLLNSVAEAMRTTPEILKLSIEGHTDDAGPDDRNLDLSRRRAAAVLTWLTTRGRVEAGRLVSEGFGETRPITPGTTPAIRAQNRRVEFRITELTH